MIRPLRARSPIRFLVGAALALAAVAVLACAVIALTMWRIVSGSAKRRLKVTK